MKRSKTFSKEMSAANNGEAEGLVVRRRIGSGMETKRQSKSEQKNYLEPEQSAEEDGAQQQGVLEKNAEELARNLFGWLGAVTDMVMQSAPPAWHVLEEHEDEHVVPRRVGATRTPSESATDSPSPECTASDRARSSRTLSLYKTGRRRRGRSPTVKPVHSARAPSKENDDDEVGTYQI